MSVCFSLVLWFHHYLSKDVGLSCSNSTIFLEDSGDCAGRWGEVRIFNWQSRPKPPLVPLFTVPVKTLELKDLRIKNFQHCILGLAYLTHRNGSRSFQIQSCNFPTSLTRFSYSKHCNYYTLKNKSLTEHLWRRSRGCNLYRCSMRIMYCMCFKMLNQHLL